MRFEVSGWKEKRPLGDRAILWVIAVTTRASSLSGGGRTGHHKLSERGPPREDLAAVV